MCNAVDSCLDPRHSSLPASPCTPSLANGKVNGQVPYTRLTLPTPAAVRDKRRTCRTSGIEGASIRTRTQNSGDAAKFVQGADALAYSRGTLLKTLSYLTGSSYRPSAVPHRNGIVQPAVLCLFRTFWLQTGLAHRRFGRCMTGSSRHTRGTTVHYLIARSRQVLRFCKAPRHTESVTLPPSEYRLNARNVR